MTKKIINRRICIVYVFIFSNRGKLGIEYDLPFNADEESLLYVMAKSSHGKDKDDKEVVLPLRVTIGVTMSLVGLFLYVVPLPICKLAAPWVLDTGIAFLIDQGITEWEDKQK